MKSIFFGIITINTRKKHLITASRLESEKHIDMLIEAAVLANIPDLSLDIYGRGRKEADLRELIEKLQCRDYVRLCGHQNLKDKYIKYEVYISFW